MAGYRKILGTGLLLGIAAALLWAAGRRYSQLAPPRLINWDLVRRTALGLCRPTPTLPAAITAELARRYADRVRQSEQLIAAYTGQSLPLPMNAIFVFDRPGWLAANIASFQQLFEPVEELYARLWTEKPVGTHMFGGLGQLFLSGQLGLLLGYLAQRVLGQYDLALLGKGPIVTGRLYFVEPNIAQLQQALSLDPEEFRFWISLHEATHAYEFEAHPWLRDYMNGLLTSYFESLSQDFLGLEGQGPSLVSLVRRVGGNLFRSKHFLELIMTSQQRQIFHQLQALMCLLEGYSNHVMHQVGRARLRSYALLKRRFEERLRWRPPSERLFIKLSGLDLKLKQYELGESFVNEVVRRRGLAFANLAWQAPQHLPTLEEISHPGQWMRRMEAFKP